MNIDDPPTGSDSQSSTVSHFSSCLRRTATRGRSGGVGNPLTFAPLTTVFDQTTHYLRSDDVHPDTQSMVPIEVMEDVIESVQQFAGVSDNAGWWCMDQSQAAWYGTGTAQFCEQFWVPHTEHPHIESAHHSGTAVWIAPVEASRPGVEAVAVAGDPSKTPGDGTTLGESVRRPCVSLLLSEGHQAALLEADTIIEMPLYADRIEQPGDLSGIPRYDVWPMDRGQFSLPAIEEAVTVRHLETVGGPRGPELEVTNPYYRDPRRAKDLLVSDPFSDTRHHNLASRFAAYESITAHPSEQSSFDPESLTTGDELLLDSIELTSLLMCGVTFGSANADVRVAGLA